ncbi:bifunctional YncE family protein/alkaline phosphatase family protein [Candidatus Poribacteria bacterium]|nr:bifunctional YncE family protein/alkaline phosphatase family protein [Candidatus Poribacteria bacterium]
MRHLAFLWLFLALVVRADDPELVVGQREDGSHVVATSQIIRPAGRSVEFGGRPVDLVVDRRGSKVWAKDNRGLVQIDLHDWSVWQELAFESGGGSMHGIAVSRDGSRVFLTTAQDMLYEAVPFDGGDMQWARKIRLPGSDGGSSHPCGIALSSDEQTAYICLSRNNSLGVVDLSSGSLVREIPVGIAPFDVVLSPDGSTAYVSNWGGRRPAEGERTAPSAGSPTLVDERGVASSGTLSVIDLASGAEIAQIATGLHPSDIVLSPDGSRLYVANANSDTVSVIDTAARTVVETISIRPDPSLPFGSATNALALSADGTVLYTANAGNNAVAVIELGSPSAVRGFIPTAWYPGAVAIDGDELFIANVKGLGSRSRKQEGSGWSVYWHLGTVSRVSLPSTDELATYTAQVKADSRVPQILRAWERSNSEVPPVPVPERVGEPSVFEHVIYVIKENRTYDQVFGDLPQGNGDPSLCIFGREVTPNHHALAEEFVLLDNFYCNGVNSADGHSWATEGNVTDHLEKSFGGFTRSYTFGDDPLTYSSTGFIWDSVLMHGLSFRNYGEMDYSEPVPRDASFADIYADYVSGKGAIRFDQNIGIDRLRKYSSRDYPGWNMRIPDVLRADVFLRELKGFEASGDLPSMTIVYLPSDHTTGTSPGAPTPRAQVADNDLALGRIVEGVSKSRFWATTCIFVVEDDPQAGFDHVDGHRSIGLVVSPYTRRGAVVSEFYNQTSVLHTMARILGIPPLNQMDALSPVMSACFTSEPDLAPYRVRPNTVPLDEMNPATGSLRGPAKYWAERSLQERFDEFDRADENTLNRILWHSVKGDEPYPAHFAGAHGTGLKALGLALDGSDDDD